jgi:hypothetical protein
MQEPGESHTNSSVRAIPYYISETKSDMRGIKAGWYAIEADGTQLTFSKVTLPKSMQSNTSELVTSSALTAGGNHRNVSYARF